MFCPACGTINPDNQTGCLNCRRELPVEALRGVRLQQVPNYLLQSVLVTFCCCLPLGIPAIVFAAQANGKLEEGDYLGALRKSKDANTWCWIALGVGIAIGVLRLVVVAAGSMH